MPGGTPWYRSPEQAMRTSQWDRVWTDVYAVGAVAYELFTGYPPFRRELDPDTHDAIRADRIYKGLRPTPITALDGRLPADLADLIDRTLVKDPEFRVEDASEPTALTVLRERWREISNRHVNLADLPLSKAFRAPGPDLNDYFDDDTEHG